MNDLYSLKSQLKALELRRRYFEQLDLKAELKRLDELERRLRAEVEP